MFISLKRCILIYIYKIVTDDENIDGSIEDEVSENKWISAKNVYFYILT